MATRLPRGRRLLSPLSLRGRQFWAKRVQEKNKERRGVSTPPGT